ncbi:hypothetical protein Godav_004172 [Gossypium davidsonii]|uniref:Uncharacterized protein n=2 Tax=Gossypium TaxID=3633 RepID=A0A7J8SLM1_GOSDV|nr:hypothetical protein [Gossypium davidsonii]MBA0662137.1 hypothetical protein [Gossypium klotzschianum]
MPFFVHGSIFWCPRRRGTTLIHPELGGYTLLQWRYCRRGYSWEQIQWRRCEACSLEN